ncbi:hypothetical protein G7054_g6479 [Neopestalotiopsis clavispora]|nr:hypothetical protein G7054_g6479 [Neopestalotiopsis clavispora]
MESPAAPGPSTSQSQSFQHRQCNSRDQTYITSYDAQCIILLSEIYAGHDRHDEMAMRQNLENELQQIGVTVAVFWWTIARSKTYASEGNVRFMNCHLALPTKERADFARLQLDGRDFHGRRLQVVDPPVPRLMRTEVRARARQARQASRQACIQKVQAASDRAARLWAAFHQTARGQAAFHQAARGQAARDQAASDQAAHEVRARARQARQEARQACIQEEQVSRAF